jgi:hypothetical protein
MQSQILKMHHYTGDPCNLLFGIAVIKNTELFISLLNILKIRNK